MKKVAVGIYHDRTLAWLVGTHQVVYQGNETTFPPVQEALEEQGYRAVILFLELPDGGVAVTLP